MKWFTKWLGRSSARPQAAFHLENLEQRALLSALMPVGPLPVVGGVETGLILPVLDLEPVPASNPLLSVTDFAPKRINVDHKKPLQEVIATFRDPAGGTDPSVYSAQVTDSAGETVSVRVVASPSGGFKIVASGTLTWGMHTLTLRLTDWRYADQSATVQASAYVIPPPIAGVGANVASVAGQVFSGVVATYTGLDLELLGRYNATIRWGDGEVSNATLVAGPNGSARVVGSHVYLKPGQYDLWINVWEQSAPMFHPLQPIGRVMLLDSSSYYNSTVYSDSRGRAIVGAGVLDGDVQPISAMTGVPFDGIIARFTPLQAGMDISSYSAVVELGNHGRLLTPPTLHAEPDGTWSVRASILFTSFQYRPPVIVDILDRSGGGEGVLMGRAKGLTAPVEAHLSAVALPFDAVGGVEFSGKVGEFTSIGAGTLWSSTFEVTIRWGDGTESAGKIIPNDQGGWDVLGTHTYPHLGYPSSAYFSFAVTESRSWLGGGLEGETFTHQFNALGTHVAIASGEIDVFSLWPTGSMWINGLEQANLQLATALVADPAMDPETFTGSVQWEDGRTSVVRFVQLSDDQFGCFLDASFPATGRYAGVLSVTIGDKSRTVSIEVQATKPWQPLPPLVTSMTPHQVDAFKGVEFTGPVATFWLNDPPADLSGLSAVISWGDGGSSAGVIVANEDGSYTIIGTHTYYAAGTGQWSVSLSGSGRSAWREGEWSVTADPTRIDADGRQLHFRQREPFTTLVASFKSPVPGAMAKDYRVVIHWGDGRRSIGKLTPKWGGGFDVSGTHAYEVHGSFVVWMKITGPGGTMLTRSMMAVDRDPVKVKPARPKLGGLRIRGQIATFADSDGKSTNPDLYRVYHAALVDWGDGQITWASIAENADGTFSVIGAHNYAKPGVYTLRLVVRRNTRHLPQERQSYTDGRDFVTLATDAGTSKVQQDEYGTRLFTIKLARKGPGKIVKGCSWK